MLQYEYKKRIIFDGYPRNLSQVKTLEKILSDNKQKIDLVLKLSVSLETIKRILERQTLEKRADDNEATAVKDTKLMKTQQSQLLNIIKN